RWRPNHLKRLLTKPFHAGFRNNGVRGEWPAILTPDEHELLRSLLGPPEKIDVPKDTCVCGKAREPGRKTCGGLACRPAILGRAGKLGHGARRRYPLSGILTCSECGSRMLGSGGLYRCTLAAGGCGKVSIEAIPLERWINGEVAAVYVERGLHRRTDAAQASDD